MSCRLGSLVIGFCLALTTQSAHAGETLFNHNYALVIGIGSYADRYWPHLAYARRDAEGMAAFLKSQGYEVYELYDGDATRTNILTALGEQIALKLAEQDRVVVFFSGHGATRTVGVEDFGYIIPYDGGQRYGTWISMTEMREASRQMSAARHQLFIFDSCYGGQIGIKGVLSITNEDHPRYIEKISLDKARQYLTAGGKNQVVLAGGPEGYSYFTGYLLKALNGAADFNGDTYITVDELAAYLGPAASNWDQTPVVGSLYGHEQGNFWFRTPGTTVSSSAVVAARSGPPRFGLKGEFHNMAGLGGPMTSAPTLDPRATAERRGVVFRDSLSDGSACDSCPEMVVLPPGELRVGSQRGSIEGSLAVGRYEVSFAEWDACVDDGGCNHRPDDRGWGRRDRPVINLSWWDANEYAMWLSKETGKYYRIPTETEWEYAARAGSTTERFWGENADEACAFANVYDQSSKQRFEDRFHWPSHACNDGFAQTAPVGTFRPNDFGLYDMLGNVREWTWEKALRGGSWSKEPNFVTSANRHYPKDPAGRGDDIGFRVARDLDAEELALLTSVSASSSAAPQRRPRVPRRTGCPGRRSPRSAPRGTACGSAYPSQHR
jgi:Sulfatase-modifying factor enzyme 1/Caspase domain